MRVAAALLVAGLGAQPVAVPIPPNGIAIYDGGQATPTVLACLWPGDEAISALPAADLPEAVVCTFHHVHR